MAALPLLKAEDGRRPWCPQRGQPGGGGRRVWDLVRGGADCLPHTCPRAGLFPPRSFAQGLWPSKTLPGSCLGWKAAGPLCSRSQVLTNT